MPKSTCEHVPAFTVALGSSGWRWCTRCGAIALETFGALTSLRWLTPKVTTTCFLCHGTGIADGHPCAQCCDPDARAAT